MVCVISLEGEKKEGTGFVSVITVSRTVSPRLSPSFVPEHGSISMYVARRV